jgi:peptidoglycan/xylan/chitin deacetylase (PgdA/CDA1 family)
MTGSVTISLEIELGWGQHDKQKNNICSADRSAEEQYLEKLLNTCNLHNIPITFNIIGHLLLQTCDGQHGGSHSEGWFAADPGTDENTDPLFYWSNLPSIISDQIIDHEFATHTFSHVLCNEIDDQTLRWELERCIELHEENDIDQPETIVTPRHRSVSYDTLTEAGICGIRALKRHPRQSTYERYKQRAMFWTLHRGHPAYDPTMESEIVELYTTPYPSLTAVHLPNGQSSPIKPFQYIPIKIRQRMQQSYLADSIKTAIKTDSNVHLWTHLYNLSNEVQWECIEQFLSSLGAAQKNGDVDVLTMAELVDREQI